MKCFDNSSLYCYFNCFFSYNNDNIKIMILIKKIKKILILKVR